MSTLPEGVLIDEADQPEVMRHKWRISPNGYVYTYIHRHITLLHRYLMRPPKGLVVDHINGNKLDNRRSNMRVVTYSQNMTNRRGATRQNSCGVRGVTWIKSRNAWQAQARLKGVYFYLGYFKVLTDAQAAVEAFRAANGFLTGEV